MSNTLTNDSLPPAVRFDALSIGDFYVLGSNAYNVLAGGSAICVYGDITGSQITPAASLMVTKALSTSFHYTV